MYDTRSINLLKMHFFYVRNLLPVSFYGADFRNIFCQLFSVVGHHSIYFNPSLIKFTVDLKFKFSPLAF